MSPAAPSRNGTGPQTFSLDAAFAAAADEADSAEFHFTYGGESYSVPNQNKWSMKLLRKLAQSGEDTDQDQVFSELLGADYDRLVEAGITLGELQFLFKSIVQNAGFDSVPNSPPPQRRGSTRT